MSKDREIDINYIESKLSSYRSFFDSTQEVNEQVLSRSSLSDTQAQFLEKLEEFDFFARSNRNPNANSQIASKAHSFIESLDEIEFEIRAEQEKRLSLDSSSKMSNLFIDDDSMIAPKSFRIEKSMSQSEQLSASNASSQSSLLEDESNDQKLPEFFNSLTAEEIHLAAEQTRQEKNNVKLNSNASVLFSILKSLQKRPDCPEFLTRNFDQEKYRGEFFQINIAGDTDSQDKNIRVVKSKDGGFAMLSNDQQGNLIEISSAEVSSTVFAKIMRVLYHSMPVKNVIMGVNLIKIANNFFIDEAGKVVCFNDNLDALCSVATEEVKMQDLQMVEDQALDLSNLYKMLTDQTFVKSSKIVRSSDGKSLVCASSGSVTGNFALENKDGIIRILKKDTGNDYFLASSAKEIVDFRQQMLSEFKNAAIFNAFSAALKGNWGLLQKASEDDRISRQEMVAHIEKFVLSEKKHPFDINFISKIAINVPSLSFNISKMMVKNRSKFLSQIIYGFSDQKYYSSSFIIKILSRSSNFLDIDYDNAKDHMHQHYLKETFGFVTNLLVNFKDVDFDSQTIFNQSDFYSSYTNTLNRYANTLLNASEEELPKNIAVIYRSFVRIINSCRVSGVATSSNANLFLNLVSETLSSFSHKPSLSLLIHRTLIDALSDSKLERSSPEFKVIIFKVCTSLLKNASYSPDIVKIFDRLTLACAENQDLVNFVRISLSQIAVKGQSQEVKAQHYSSFTNQQRLDALKQIDIFNKNIEAKPGQSSAVVAKKSPQFFTYDEVNTITSSTRRQLADFSIDLTPSRNKPKILKYLREIEGKHQSSSAGIVNLTQSFSDYNRCFTKTIIQDESGRQLFKIGDSIHDFITAPINYYFADDPKMREHLLEQVKELDVAAQSSGYNSSSFADQETLKRLNPRLSEAIKNVARLVHENYSTHPYLVFLKGFNQAVEGEMLQDTQALLQRYGEKYLCNSRKETVTVKLSRSAVTYQSNCEIAITKQDLAPTAPIAVMQSTGQITVNYHQSGEVINNSYLHNFKNIDLDVKTADEIQNFISQNANCHQFDQVFRDLMTDPASANALSSLINDPNSPHKKIAISANEEQIYVPRTANDGFVFSITRNPDRSINDVILHDGLYQYNKRRDDLIQLKPDLQPANFKELSIKLNKVEQLGHSINNVTRPLKDAFCQLSSTKFSKKSKISDVKKTTKYKFRYRKIGKLDSGKSLYLDENGRLLVNNSSTSTNLVPIASPGIHAIEKIPADEVSQNFELNLRAQHFDLRSKTFSRYPQTFSVQVRKIGQHIDRFGKQLDILQDRQGRYFKSMPNSARIQEILDLNNPSQSHQVQNIITSFKERAHIHEIFNIEKPEALVENSDEVTIGKIQYLKSDKSDKSRTPVREIKLQANTKSKEKAFHIDRFGEIYTKDSKGKIQKHDLINLDQQSRAAVVKAIDLTYDNLYLTNIYQLLEKSNSDQKQPVDVKPYDCDAAHVFVKNGAHYALFKDNHSQDHHLMRLDYPQSVKKSKTGVITDPDQIQLITSQIHAKAIYDDLDAGLYLINGGQTLKISQIQDGDDLIKTFALSQIDKTIVKDSPQDLHLAIDSNYRVSFKKPEEQKYHLADFRQTKKLMPHFEKCAKTSLVKLENWKSHYNQLMAQRSKVMKKTISAVSDAKISSDELHQTSKKTISAPNKIPSPHISTISVDHLHRHEYDDEHLR